MAVDIKKHSIRIKQLCEDYYRNNITYVEFKYGRDLIFDEIDNEQGFVVVEGTSSEDHVGADELALDEDVQLTHE